MSVYLIYQRVKRLHFYWLIPALLTTSTASTTTCARLVLYASISFCASTEYFVTVLRAGAASRELLMMNLEETSSARY